MKFESKRKSKNWNFIAEKLDIALYNSNRVFSILFHLTALTCGFSVLMEQPALTIRTGSISD